MILGLLALLFSLEFPSAPFVLQKAPGYAPFPWFPQELILQATYLSALLLPLHSPFALLLWVHPQIEKSRF